MHPRSGQSPQRRVSVWRSCRIAVISLGLALAFGAGARAQLGSGVSAGGPGARTPGLKRDGNAYEFVTPDGATSAPLAFSYFRPGIQEPTLQDRIWWYCDDDGSVVTCIQKINYKGVLLPVQELKFALQ